MQNSENDLRQKQATENDIVVDPVKKPLRKKRKRAPTRKRSKMLSLRLTPEELTFLNKKAQEARMSRTDYVLAACRGEVIVVVDGAREIYYELKKQGVNLNQLLKTMREWRSPYCIDIRYSLKQCYDVQRKVAQFIDDWNVKLLKKEDEDNANIGNDFIKGNTTESY